MSTGAGSISQNMCSGTKQKTQAAEKRASKFRTHWTTNLRAVYIHNTRNQQTFTYTSCRAFRFQTLLQKLAVHSMYFDNIVDALVNGLHTEISSQHQIHCNSENTDTYHFRSHGSTHSQRYGHFTDCDPRVPVHSFDHNTTTTSTVSLGAAVAKASVFLPLPVPLQQLCHHHLKMLTTDAINASDVSLLAPSEFFFIF